MPKRTTETTEEFGCERIAKHQRTDEPESVALVAVKDESTTPTDSSTRSNAKIAFDYNDRFENDRKHLLGIFPAEIWLLIFEKVADPTQLEKVNNSSLFLRELLRPQRVNFMFQNVWKMIASKFEIKETPVLPLSAQIRALVAAANGPPSTSVDDASNDIGDLLKVRKVCRSWNNAFDNYYQNHPDHFILHNEGFMNRGNMLKLLGTDIKAGKAFRDHFIQTHGTRDRNVFFTRKISIVMDGRMSEDFLKMEYMLRLHGHQVWYCDFKLLPGSYPFIAYLKLRSFLVRMPNLKVLGMSFAGCQCATFLNLLQAAVDTSSLPSLPQLQLLKTTSVPMPLFKQLIGLNPNLTTLRMTSQQIGDIYQTDILQLPLKSLSLEIFDKTDFEKMANPEIKWPLEKLYVSYKPMAPSDRFQWKMLYDIIGNKFKDTLNLLHINIAEGIEILLSSDFPKRSVYSANLPHLTHLELNMKYLMSLDFILPMKDTLTDLDISLDIRDAILTSLEYASLVEDIGSVRIFGCVNNLRESNIWTLFPKLERLHLKFCGLNEEANYSLTRNAVNRP